MLSWRAAKDPYDLWQGNTIFFQRDLNLKLFYCFFVFCGERNFILDCFSLDGLQFTRIALEKMIVA